MNAKKHAVPEELLSGLLADYKKPEDLIGENGLLKQLTKMLVERALEVEMAEHLGHGKSEPVSNSTGNTRNGHSTVSVRAKPSCNSRRDQLEAPDGEMIWLATAQGSSSAT